MTNTVTFISASFGEETVNLFTGMSAAVAVLSVVGLILIITEFFRPMKGVGYVSGGAVLMAAVLVRMFSGGTVGTLLVQLLLYAVILLAAHLVMLALYKREWLLVSAGYADDEPSDGAEYSYLVGLRGITTTRVDMSGHMSINDINFYVTSRLPIEAGVEVIVKTVSGVEIIVEPLDPPSDSQNAN